MGNLIKSDDLGNWGVKGLPWKNLYVGNVITREVHEKLYGCLCKLRKTLKMQIVMGIVNTVATAKM